MRVIYEMPLKSFNSFFQVVKQNSLNVKEKKLSKIAFSHVGCEKNLVDTEHMQGLLDKEGYEVDSNINDANVVVVNTCSFIETAREESIRKILEYTNQGKEVIVAGCMAQHFKDELIKEIPEIKGLVGTGDYQKIAKVLDRVEKGEIVNEVSKIPEFIADEEMPRFVDKNKFVAYLRIAEGCNYNCAFCIIPKLRGPQRSRTIESIVSEAKSKNLNIIKFIYCCYILELVAAWIYDSFATRGTSVICW